MNAFKFLSAQSSGLFILAILASIASGISTTALLVLLFRPFGGGPAAISPALLFLAFAVVSVAGRGISRDILGRVGRRGVRQLRVDLAQRVISTPLIELERIGSSRLITSLSDDMGRIAVTLPSVALMCTNLALIATCLGYLFWLSIARFVEISCIIALGIFCHYLFYVRGAKHIRIGRRKWDEVLVAFRSLVDGAKELQLNATRRRWALRMFEAQSKSLERSGGDQALFFGSAATTAQILFFIALGVAAFGFARGIDIDTQSVAVGYTLSIIYMMGPLQGVVVTMHDLKEASIAIDRVQELGLALGKARDFADEAGGVAAPVLLYQLRLVGIAYGYGPGSRDATFAVGPVDLTLNPGEIVFISGGNGSGKTTFAKVLAGLYAPTAGEVRFGPHLVDDHNRDWYRQHFSAVFGDFFLFDRLIGPAVGRDNMTALMARLRMGDRISLEGDALSRVDALSLGERKRLALLHAWLEDRPIYLFDEWASDQEPTFKDLFYNELLPELRERGKLVIVISHDDRYFHVADKILALDRGRPPAVRYPKRPITANA